MLLDDAARVWNYRAVLDIGHFIFLNNGTFKFRKTNEMFDHLLVLLFIGLTRLDYQS